MKKQLIFLFLFIASFSCKQNPKEMKIQTNPQINIDENKNIGEVEIPAGVEFSNNSIGQKSEIVDIENVEDISNEKDLNEKKIVTDNKNKVFTKNTNRQKIIVNNNFNSKNSTIKKDSFTNENIDENIDEKLKNAIVKRNEERNQILRKKNEDVSFSSSSAAKFIKCEIAETQNFFSGARIKLILKENFNYNSIEIVKNTFFYAMVNSISKNRIMISVSAIKNNPIEVYVLDATDGELGLFCSNTSTSSLNSSQVSSTSSQLANAVGLGAVDLMVRSAKSLKNNSNENGVVVEAGKKILLKIKS